MTSPPHSREQQRMGHAARLARFALPLLFACQPPAPAEDPDALLNYAPSTPTASSSAHVAAPPGPYSGHGAESIPPEVLAEVPAPRPPAGGRAAHPVAHRRPRPRHQPPEPGRKVDLLLLEHHRHRSRCGSSTARARSRGSSPAARTAPSAVAVTPDGAWLVVQRDRKGEENPGLYLQPAEGGSLGVIQHVAKVQTHFEMVSRDSKYVYFTSNDKKPDAYVVYRWDIATGEREVVFDREGLWHVSDLRRRRARSFCASRPARSQPSTSSGTRRKRELTPLFGQGEKEEYDARYGAKDGEFIVLTNKPGEFRRLYSWTRAGSHAARRRCEAGRRAPSTSTRRARASSTPTNESGYHAPARARRAARTGPSPPRAPRCRPGRLRADARRTAASRRSTSTTAVTRPQGYVVDWSQGKARGVARAEHARDRHVDVRPRASSSSYTARTGRGFLSSSAVPTKCASDPCPVIVAFHGGPEGRRSPGST